MDHYEFRHKDTHVKVLADNDRYINLVLEEVVRQRRELEQYILKSPSFLSALKPIAVREDAPEIVKIMAEGGEIAAVGPMAAVAGAIAELAVKKAVGAGAKTVLVENGGDIFMKTAQPLTIGVFSGYNELADRLAFRAKAGTTLGICSSSSKLGHSLSVGDCDLVTVFSRKAAIADAIATALCNMVKEKGDIQKALEWGVSREGVAGVLIVKGKNIGMIGDIPELLRNEDSLLVEKITKEHFYSLSRNF
jgi:hypothetical protein